MTQNYIYPRHVKGYRFECEINDLAINNYFTNLECNDLESIQTWYRSIGKGADFKFHINGKQIEAEVKYLDEKCYHCWVLRDYIPRFSFAPNTIPVIVCNNIFNISHSGREELKRKHIKLMNQYQFTWYLFRVSRRRGNQYIGYRNRYYYTSSSAQNRTTGQHTNLTNNTAKINTETTQTKQIKNHSLDHKTTNSLQDMLILIWITGITLLPLLEYTNQFTRKIKNTFWRILYQA